MPSLTETAGVSRQVIKWGIVGLIGLMIGRAVIGGLIAWYKATHPVIPPPTMGFGRLPELEFPVNERPELTYRLETVTGRLPKMPEQAEVLLMSFERPNLLAMERSIKEAGNLGFKDQPEKLSDLSYRWRIATPIPSSLTMMIYDGRFEWNTDWTLDPNFLVKKTLPQQTQAVKESRDYLRKIGESADDLPEKSAKVSYLKGLSGNFLPATSLSDADFIQVDLFRSNYQDKYPFVTPDPAKGLVRVILSGNSKAGRVVKMEFNYFVIEYNTFETYPLKTPEAAWAELTNGGGYIAKVDRGVSEAIVRRVELAYYDSFTPQHYSQPVYLFTGDNNFVAYVAAIDQSF